MSFELWSVLEVQRLTVRLVTGYVSNWGKVMIKVKDWVIFTIMNKIRNVQHGGLCL